jgi:hypothetical protein
MSVRDQLALREAYNRDVLGQVAFGRTSVCV